MAGHDVGILVLRTLLGGTHQGSRTGEERKMEPDFVNVQTPRCVHCGNHGMLEHVDFERFKRWMDGEYIQDALPMLTPDERELLISGTHAHCWVAMWGEPYDD